MDWDLSGIRNGKKKQQVNELARNGRVAGTLTSNKLAFALSITINNNKEKEKNNYFVDLLPAY